MSLLAPLLLTMVALPAMLAGCGSSEAASGGEENKSGGGGTQMLAGGTYISNTACEKLGESLAARLGRPVQADPREHPLRFTECSLRSGGDLVVLYVDSTIPLRGRYLARIQTAREQARLVGRHLEPLPALGEGPDGETGAYWLPTITSSLYLYRKDGWMTVLYTVKGETNAQRRAGAVALASRALELLSRS